MPFHEAGPTADRLSALLRADLEPYTVDDVEQALGPVAHAALSREQQVPALRVLDPADSVAADAVGCLTWTFLLGRPIDRRRLERALPHLGVDGAVRLGLVEAAGSQPDDEVRPLVALRPYQAERDWWLACDLGELAAGGRLRADHVLGVGGASLTLARFTIRNPVQRVLDLGTGCGVQALHATQHSDHVVATDISQRALAFARFNLALNGVGDRVDLRAGDMLHPVAGEQFDLVVSNPPFVVTPRRADLTTYTYRDGGLEGDAVVERLVAGIGRHLLPGGTAQLLGNWELRRGVPWQQRVAAWLDADAANGVVLDAWVIQREVQDVAEYAETWLRDAGRPGHQEWQSAYLAYLDDFAGREVEGVGFGLITVRRREARTSVRPPLRRFEELRGGRQQPLGACVAAGLAAEQWLRDTDDDTLCTVRLRVAADVTEERHHRPGTEHPEAILLRQGGGFERVVQVSGQAAAVVGACDGELPVGVLLDAVADLMDLSPGQARQQVLPVVRHLIVDGLLLHV